VSNHDRAEAARKAAQGLGDMLHEKQLAYGDAGGIQRKIWQALLEQYEATGWETVGMKHEGDQPLYIIPRELMDHIPRLTRVFDRICRIVSNPAGDRMGEDPWRDLAGDAIIGMIMPRTERPPQQVAGEKQPVPGVYAAGQGDPHASRTRLWAEAPEPDLGQY
jgi:hypothetical protein